VLSSSADTDDHREPRSVTRHAAPSTQHWLVHLALFTVALLFSLNYIISKVALGTFNPVVFAYLRIVGAAIVLHLLLRHRETGELSRADAWRLVGYAMLAVVINQTLFLGGLALTSAHVAAILITSVPVFALAGAIFVGRERATVAKVVGIATALAGALLVVGSEGFAGATKSLIGDLLILCNSFSYAMYLVLSKPMMARVSARRVVGRMFALAAFLMVPIAAWPLARERWAAIPMKSWTALILVILGPTVSAYLLAAWALKHADASLVATYSYLQPIITAVLAWMFLGEHIHAVAVVAALLIFTGVYLSGRAAPLVE
jgi:drug/metabolite transporter (DMT)-like permease